MGKNKIFYVPGLISLMGLPILILIFKPEDKVQKSVITLSTPNDDTTSDHSFTKASVNRILEGKKIEQIFLNDYDAFDDKDIYISKRKLTFIKNELERIKFTNDTSIVLKIKFGQETTYGQYVAILNLAIIYKVNRYVYMNDEFYFFSDPPPAPVKIDPLMLSNDVISYLPAYQHPNAWHIFNLKMQWKSEKWWFEIKENKLLTIGFIILIIIPGLLRLLTRNKKT